MALDEVPDDEVRVLEDVLVRWDRLDAVAGLRSVTDDGM